MANIKIAQLTNQTTIADTDLVIVETATSTNKMTVANLKEQLGINDMKVVQQNVGSVGITTITLEPNNVYMLLIGRDQGLYFISTFTSSSYITTLSPLAGAGSISVSEVGFDLTIDLSTRVRPWSLVKLSSL